MSHPSFEVLLKTLDTHPLLDASITKGNYMPLNLSISNSELQEINVASAKDLGNFIQDQLKQKDAKVAYGGYLEKRGIYQRSVHFNQSNPETERNIHIGLDIWVDAGCSVFAPLDGIIHSFKNNTNYGDYGPTIILKHTIKGAIFYTLYGHLSLESLENCTVGQEIKQGESFAKIGTVEVNGDYPPHLHFQIIKEIQDYEGDYPGVSNQLDLGFFKVNCPDPKLILQLD